jgi:hypothetical protein
MRDLRKSARRHPRRLRLVHLSSEGLGREGASYQAEGEARQR